jgi:DNA polymerase-1
VDGSSFIYRAFFALPQLTTKDGKAVGAIYGFCSTLISLLETHRSDFFCVVLDSGRATFRSELFPEYKANRAATPEELKEQFPLLKNACHAFGVPTVEKIGFEADDLMATCAQKFVNEGVDVRIISSDKDLMQLINEHISMFDPIKSKVIKSNDVFEKYGVYPEQMVHFQALVGDTSDNIPGIKGIGPVTAAKLLQTYKTLDGIYDHINDIQPPKLKEKLTNGKNDLNLSLKLVTLEKNVALNDNFLNFLVSHNPNAAVHFLSSLDFTNLVKRVQKKSVQEKIKERTIKKISSIGELKNFFELSTQQKISFFCSSCSNGSGVLALCDGFSVGSCVFSITNGADLFNQNLGLDYFDVCATVKPYFENPQITKISVGGGLKYFRSIDFASYDDISLMSYLLQGPVGNRIRDIFRVADDAMAALTLENICEPDQICKISEMIFDASEDMHDELTRNNLLDIYEKLDVPMINILKNMEEKGVRVSSAKLNQLADIFSKKIKELEQKIFAAVGYEFKIGSAKQLAEALFEKLNIPHSSKKTTLDQESLEELSIHSDVPELVIEWRSFSKLLSSYTHSLCKLINPKTGRLHTTFSMTSTSTGRLSSAHPNLQNIPARSEVGRLIKSAFVSEEGHKLLSFDYSQIELHVLAHVANIKFLREAIIARQDMHASTAAGIFNVPIGNVTKEMRSHAKTINFALLYGMSSFRLSKTLGVSKTQANEYIKNYFERFPEFNIFKEETLAYARKYGHVRTILGRKCYIKDINSKNFQLRHFSERQAVNAVIQGSAADIVKTAMINLSPLLKSIHSSMLLQIHDELIFETENNFVEQAAEIIKNIMEAAGNLSVPLYVNMKIGDCLSAPANLNSNMDIK